MRGVSLGDEFSGGSNFGSGLIRFSGVSNGGFEGGGSFDFEVDGFGVNAGGAGMITLGLSTGGATSFSTRANSRFRCRDLESKVFLSRSA